VLIWSFHQALPSPQVAACQSWLPAQIYGSKDGLPAFAAAPVRLNLAGGPAGGPAVAQPAAPPDDTQLITALVQLDGQAVTVRHSPTDMGEAANLFDQSDDTLIRSQDANPVVLELEFAQPRSISAISMTLAAIQHIQITVKLTSADDKTTTFSRDLTNLEGIPVVDLPAPDGVVRASRVRIEILDLAPPADATHIHIRELRLR
jgi:hypothetical protein